jgi:hypothetical protein
MIKILCLYDYKRILNRIECLEKAITKLRDEKNDLDRKITEKTTMCDKLITIFIEHPQSKVFLMRTRKQSEAVILLTKQSNFRLLKETPIYCIKQ